MIERGVNVSTISRYDMTSLVGDLNHKEGRLNLPQHHQAFEQAEVWIHTPVAVVVAASNHGSCPVVAAHDLYGHAVAEHHDLGSACRHDGRRIFGRDPCVQYVSQLAHCIADQANKHMHQAFETTACAQVLAKSLTAC